MSSSANMIGGKSGRFRVAGKAVIAAVKMKRMDPKSVEESMGITRKEALKKLSQIRDKLSRLLKLNDHSGKPTDRASALLEAAQKAYNDAELNRLHLAMGRKADFEASVDQAAKALSEARKALLARGSHVSQVQELQRTAQRLKMLHQWVTDSGQAVEHAEEACLNLKEQRNDYYDVEAIESVVRKAVGIRRMCMREHQKIKSLRPPIDTKVIDRFDGMARQLVEASVAAREHITAALNAKRDINHLRLSDHRKIFLQIKALLRSGADARIDMATRFANTAAFALLNDMTSKAYEALLKIEDLQRGGARQVDVVTASAEMDAAMDRLASFISRFNLLILKAGVEGAQEIAAATILRFWRAKVLPRTKQLRLENSAAITVQAILRRKLAQMEATARRQEALQLAQMRREASAVQIQSICRGIALRRRLGIEQDAALRLQVAVRSGLARREVQRMRLQRELILQAEAEIEQAQRNFAAARLQSVMRGTLARVHLNELSESAAKVQALFRGGAARSLAKRQTQAAVDIQRVQRGRSSRRYTAHLRGELRARDEQRDFAAVRIQAQARGTQARRQYSARLEERTMAWRAQQLVDASAAATIQSIVRGHIARGNVRKMEAELLGHKSSAAEVIERVARGFLGRLKSRAQAREREAEEAANFLQARLRALSETRSARSRAVSAVTLWERLALLVDKADRIGNGQASLARLQAECRQLVAAAQAGGMAVRSSESVGTVDSAGTALRLFEEAVSSAELGTKVAEHVVKQSFERVTTDEIARAQFVSSSMTEFSSSFATAAALTRLLQLVHSRHLGAESFDMIATHIPAVVGRCLNVVMAEPEPSGAQSWKVVLDDLESVRKQLERAPRVESSFDNLPQVSREISCALRLLMCESTIIGSESAINSSVYPKRSVGTAAAALLRVLARPCSNYAQMIGQIGPACQRALQNALGSAFGQHRSIADSAALDQLVRPEILAAIAPSSLDLASIGCLCAALRSLRTTVANMNGGARLATYRPALEDLLAYIEAVCQEAQIAKCGLRPVGSRRSLRHIERLVAQLSCCDIVPTTTPGGELTALFAPRTASEAGVSVALVALLMGSESHAGQELPKMVTESVLQRLSVDRIVPAAVVAARKTIQILEHTDSSFHDSAMPEVWKGAVKWLRTKLELEESKIAAHGVDSSTVDDSISYCWSTLNIVSPSSADDLPGHLARALALLPLEDRASVFADSVYGTVALHDVAIKTTSSLSTHSATHPEASFANSLVDSTVRRCTKQLADLRVWSRTCDDDAQQLLSEAFALGRFRRQLADVGEFTNVESMHHMLDHAPLEVAQRVLRAIRLAHQLRARLESEDEFPSSDSARESSVVATAMPSWKLSFEWMRSCVSNASLRVAEARSEASGIVARLHGMSLAAWVRRLQLHSLKEAVERRLNIAFFAIDAGRTAVRLAEAGLDYASSSSMLNVRQLRNLLQDAFQLSAAASAQAASATALSTLLTTLASSRERSRQLGTQSLAKEPERAQLRSLDRLALARAQASVLGDCVRQIASSQDEETSIAIEVESKHAELLHVVDEAIAAESRFLRRPKHARPRHSSVVAGPVMAVAECKQLVDQIDQLYCQLESQLYASGRIMWALGSPFAHDNRSVGYFGSTAMTGRAQAPEWSMRLGSQSAVASVLCDFPTPARWSPRQQRATLMSSSNVLALVDSSMPLSRMARQMEIERLRRGLATAAAIVRASATALRGTISSLRQKPTSLLPLGIGTQLKAALVTATRTITTADLQFPSKYHLKLQSLRWDTISFLHVSAIRTVFSIEALKRAVEACDNHLKSYKTRHEHKPAARFTSVGGDTMSALDVTKSIANADESETSKPTVDIEIALREARSRQPKRFGSSSSSGPSESPASARSPFARPSGQHLIAQGRNSPGLKSTMARNAQTRSPASSSPSAGRSPGPPRHRGKPTNPKSSPLARRAVSASHETSTAARHEGSDLANSAKSRPRRPRELRTVRRDESLRARRTRLYATASIEEEKEGQITPSSESLEGDDALIPQAVIGTQGVPQPVPHFFQQHGFATPGGLGVPAHAGYAAGTADAYGRGMVGTASTAQNVGLQSVMWMPMVYQQQAAAYAQPLPMWSSNAR